MKLYIQSTKNSTQQVLVRQMVDFLAQRGHEILGLQIKGVPTFNFEHRLAALNSCDLFIYEASDGGFTEGFMTALATGKLHKKTLFIYQDKCKNLVPEVVLGCTYPNSYCKSYQTWSDLQNILTLLKL